MKKTRKPTKAQRELAAAEQKMRDKWANMPKFSRTPVRARSVQIELAIPTMQAPPGRETRHIPSLQTTGGDATKPIEGKRYTGTAMLGIGTLHKSNAVPIFSSDDAVQISRMRRG